MTQTLLELGITINIQDNPEHRILVKRDLDWNDAIELAIQCRKTRSSESIEILPLESGLFTVVRVVYQ